MAQKRFKCIVSGTEKYFSPASLKKKVSKFGTETEFAKYYVSTECRALIKAGKTVHEARQHLNIQDDLPEVDMEILIKLKLIKLNKRKGTKEADEARERYRYLNSAEFKEKKADIQKRRQNMTRQERVEEMTGGPNGCQVSRGGTCIRPDTYLTYNDRACDGCEYFEYCVCDNKRLSHDKQIKRRRVR
jgi:hypothetical protein|tara:strand:+ start:68 stop:631 length:564 start_codon:yes stop_codon:yes gene_type:complete